MPLQEKKKEFRAKLGSKVSLDACISKTTCSTNLEEAIRPQLRTSCDPKST